MFDELPALFHAGVIRREPLDNARLSSNSSDGLTDIIVQLTCHITAHALFGFQQPFSEMLIARQFLCSDWLSSRNRWMPAPSNNPVRLCTSSESNKSTG